MTEAQEAILMIVRRHSTPTSGWCTAEIAQFIGRQPCRLNARQHSAWVLWNLKQLEASGYVRRLDDGSPVVWTADPSSAPGVRVVVPYFHGPDNGPGDRGFGERELTASEAAALGVDSVDGRKG